MTPEEIRDIAADIVLDHARDIEFLSVVENLADAEVDDPDNELARQIHDLAMSAVITVDFPEPTGP